MGIYPASWCLRTNHLQPQKTWRFHWWSTTQALILDKYPQLSLKRLTVLSPIVWVAAPGISKFRSIKREQYQWPFQDPKLEVATIYKAYFLGLCKGIPIDNIRSKNRFQYLPAASKDGSKTAPGQKQRWIEPPFFIVLDHTENMETKTCKMACQSIF